MRMRSFFSSFFKPRTRTAVVHIDSDNGFHLRPAAALAAEAKKMRCRVEVEYRGERVDAKNPQALLALGMEAHEHFDLICSGEEAEKALSHLTAFLSSLWASDNATDTRHDTADSEKIIDDSDNSVLHGIDIGKGIAVAPLYRAETDECLDIPTGDFESACAQLRRELDKNAEAEDAFAEIARAHRILLDSLCDTADDYESFREAVETQCRTLAGSTHEAKCSDYRDLLARLWEIGDRRRNETRYPSEPFILAVEALSPSQAASLPPQTVGVVTTQTPRNGHAAMLLRAASIPALTVDTLPDTTNTPVVLDASDGKLYLNPDEALLRRAEAAQTMQREAHKIAEKRRFDTATRRDGRRIKVMANVSDIASAEAAAAAGAEGIGLLRTEFLCEAGVIPDLDTQIAHYRKIFALFSDVTVRTFDIGGDKPLSGITLPDEPNPFLGIRGIRLLHHIPEVFETQLLAIYRAAQNRAIRIMFPMVDTPERFEEAKAFALETARRHKEEISHIRFGMMVEVPSVLFDVARFDACVDFYSIGTNDLAQYLFAVDRTHPVLSYDPHAPALLHALAYFVSQTDKPVSLCGEIAADLEMTQALTELGIETFSVPPAAVAALKEQIRHV